MTSFMADGILDIASAKLPPEGILSGSTRTFIGAVPVSSEVLSLIRLIAFGLLDIIAVSILGDIEPYLWPFTSCSFGSSTTVSRGCTIGLGSATASGVGAGTSWATTGSAASFIASGGIGLASALIGVLLNCSRNCSLVISLLTNLVKRSARTGSLSFSSISFGRMLPPRLSVSLSDVNLAGSPSNWLRLIPMLL